MNNSIRISCDKSNLQLIRNFVTEFLSTYALNEIIENQIVLAVDEISANLIIHANGEDTRRYICLSINRENGSFIIELADWGTSFNPGERPPIDLEELIRKRKKGGLGLALVKRIMDKVEFSSDNGKNVCRLYKTA